MIWSAKYETGNTQVDEEHKEIFRLVQKVMDVTTDNPQDANDTMAFLAGYTVDHFKHEERLMEESSYPAISIHKKQHSDFVEQVVAMIERVKNETDGEKNLTDIKKVVVNWLTDHVLGSDKVMADHYRKWSA